MLARCPGQTSLLFAVRVPGNAADWSDVALQRVGVSVEVYGLINTEISLSENIIISILTLALGSSQSVASSISLK